MYHAIGRGNVFARHPAGWKDSIDPPSTVIAFAQTSKTKYPVLLPASLVFDQKLIVISRTDLEHFALLCSSIHYIWAHSRGGSGMRTDAVYTPSDIYETLPMPGGAGDALETIGAAYDTHRREMLRVGQIGLTQLYNRFHDPDTVAREIAELRTLHHRLDQAVATAYGWTDLDLGHAFYAVPYLPENDRIRFTISEPARLEVLRRLSRLNRERWQAEQDAAGTVPGSPTAPGALPRPRLELVSSPGQPDLFN